MNRDNSELDDLIDLQDIIDFFLNNKKIIFTITSTFAFLSVLFSLLLPNIYVSNAVLLPNDEQENMSSLLGSYSSLANIAGVSLPKEETSKSEEAIERLQSLDFFKEHFLPHINLEDLFAVKKWRPKSNTIEYKKRVFNKEENTWVRKVKFPKQKIPTAQEAYKEYIEILSINTDKETNFVKISIEHKSPYIAKEWLDIIVKNINESMREIDKKNANNSIDFLYQSSEETNLSEIREAISHLLESQLQSLMMASIDNNYIFKIIDSPVVPEEKSKPSRALICILVTFFGFFISLIFVYIRSQFPSKP